MRPNTTSKALTPDIVDSVFADFAHTDVVDNYVSRNNILAVGKYAIHQRHDDTTNDYDYDNCDKGGWDGLFRWGPEWPDSVINTLAEFQAISGQEAHGISADPGWVDAGNMNFNLRSDSACIDKGVVLAGFNAGEAFVGTRPLGTTDLMQFLFSR